MWDEDALLAFSLTLAFCLCLPAQKLAKPTSSQSAAWKSSGSALPLTVPGWKRYAGNVLFLRHACDFTVKLKCSALVLLLPSGSFPLLTDQSK